MKKTVNRPFALLLAALLLTACAPASGRGGESGGAPAPSQAAAEAPAPETAEPAPEAGEPAPDAPETAQAGGEGERYDAVAYRAAADAVRAEFAALDMAELEDYDEARHPELPWYTAVVGNTQRGGALYSGLWDFNGDAVPELLIAVGDETYRQPVAVYAFDGEKMVYLCKEQALGERASLTWTDGLFFIRASGGAATGSVIVYRIAPDGYGTELIEIMEYEYQDPETVTYTPRLGGMTPEELERYDYMKPFDLPVDDTRFAP